VPTDTVMSWLSRGRERLRRHMHGDLYGNKSPAQAQKGGDDAKLIDCRLLRTFNPQQLSVLNFRLCQARHAAFWRR